MNDTAIERQPTGPLAWSDAFLLGFGPLDDTHREFVEVVAALQSASANELPQRLAAVLAHALAHFEQERMWMAQTQFPAMQCHVDEHEAVLRSLREVTDLVHGGADPELCRDIGRALADWFPGHADYMDAPLSHWMSKRTFGGAPVVVRRGVATPASAAQDETA